MRKEMGDAREREIYLFVARRSYVRGRWELTNSGGQRLGWTAGMRGECLGRILSYRGSSLDCSRRLGGSGSLSILSGMRRQVWQW